MKLEPASSPRGEETGRLEDVEMLGDGLASRTQPVLHREATAQLEQRLTVSVDELIEDRPPRGISERLEEVGHDSTICGSSSLTVVGRSE